VLLGDGKVDNDAKEQLHFLGKITEVICHEHSNVQNLLAHNIKIITTTPNAWKAFVGTVKYSH